MVEGEISFGRLRVDLARRELWRDGTPMRLGSRALDILSVLASAGGKVITKDELMERVWAGSRSSRRSNAIDATPFPNLLRAWCRSIE